MTDPAMTAAAPPAKTLSFWAIFAIAANTMNGPGITTLPDVAGDAGLCLYAALLALSVAMVAFVCRRMVHAMWASVDYDYDADGRVASERGGDAEARPLDDAEEPDDVDAKTEWASLVALARRPLLARTSIVGSSREAYGHRASNYVSVVMIASALCLALAQMMLAAAIIDGLFVALRGQSCALGLPAADAGDWRGWVYCTRQPSMKPYAGSGAPVALLSAGLAVAAAASIALGTYDLDEMLGVQYALFGCLVVAVARFAWVLRGMAGDLAADAAAADDGGEGLSAADDGGGGGAVPWLLGPHPFQTVGPIMFNFAFVVTAPPSVVLAPCAGTAARALAWSCAAMGGMYAVVGLSGAAAAAAVRDGRVAGGAGDSNLLSLILLSGGAGGASLLDLGIIGLFGFSTLASIPVYCLLAKQKIAEFGVSPVPSFVLSNVLPWALVALTYNAAFFEAFVNWSGLLILGYANFSLPLLLDLKLKQTRAAVTALSERARTALDKDARTTAATRGVLTAVTASITLVIAMSVTGSLAGALVAFLLVALAMKSKL